MGDAFLRDFYVAIDYDDKRVDIYGYFREKSFARISKLLKIIIILVGLVFVVVLFICCKKWRDRKRRYRNL